MARSNKFVFYRQLNAMDCGPTCLKMISKFYGIYLDLEKLRHKSGFSRSGVSLFGISETAEHIGFRTRGVRLSFYQLQQVLSPCILHWDQNHFVVLISISRTKVKIADPGKGIITYTHSEFLKHWVSSRNETGEEVGFALLMEPTPLFYKQEGDKEKKLSWRLFFQYLNTNRWQVTQVFIALAITSLLQLAFPFLTQSIVDSGINVQNLNFVMVVLAAQTMLIFSRAIVDFIRNRLLMRISNNLNIQILSDFWIKLTKLPVSYFDIHHTGDTLQRIGDHKHIQAFLTSSAIFTLFSFANFIIYAIVMILYSLPLFSVFCVGSIIYFVWVALFMRIRRKLNYENFQLSTKENDATLQLIHGMQELRLNNAEKYKRWEWENIQASIFKLNFKNLNYSQWQESGALLINETQGVIISFIVAYLVIEGKLTFGSMLAIQYLIGQLNAPIQQWIGFMQSAQDAKISLERINEIHQLDEEEKSERIFLKSLPEKKTILLKNLSFTYPGAENSPVFERINLEIPENKVTAIVGASGSGKTTMVKLLLKVYNQYGGEIRIGFDGCEEGINFNLFSHSYWRGRCGAVLQDGFVFNDTIANNISIGSESVDFNRIVQSCRIANFHSFVESLPNGYFTKLGVDGMGISQGQKQRLLIARAIYKDPDYIFFDEATNALDANNEKTIVENLSHFFKGRTVVIVAHRLSTVKNSDKIVVLEKGRIVEEGTHISLTKLKGKYFELVKNQLELGN